MGFFKDTSGLDASADFGGGNNASADFARMSAVNPAQFGTGSGGLFDRLFGGGKKTAPAPSVADTNPVTTPTATTAIAPGPTPAAPMSHKPAISSAPSLVRRIVESSKPPPPPTAQNAPFNVPQFAPAGPQPPPQMQLPQFQGIPQFPNPQPPQRMPMREPIAPMDNSERPMAPPQLPPSPMAGAFAGPAMPQQASLPMPTQPPTPAQLIQMEMTRRGSPSPMAVPQGFFRGGPLHMMRGGYPAHLMMGLPQRFAGGGMPPGAPHMGGKQGYVPPDGMGDGRSDHVDAKLSPGEFVQDAETVSLLGNGDNEAGARGMEAIRKEIRELKGKALAKGKFSPNAKSPDHYAKVGVRAAKGRG